LCCFACGDGCRQVGTLHAGDVSVIQDKNNGTIHMFVCLSFYPCFIPKSYFKIIFFVFIYYQSFNHFIKLTGRPGEANGKRERARLIGETIQPVGK
jgi:hypothetical protein